LVLVALVVQREPQLDGTPLRHQAEQPHSELTSKHLVLKEQSQEQISTATAS